MRRASAGSLQSRPAVAPAQQMKESHLRRMVVGATTRSGDLTLRSKFVYKNKEEE